jgi:hypothetical protein
LIAALPAQSADLYGPRYGSAYEDPPAYESYAEPEEEFEAPYRSRHAYKHDYKDDAFDRYYDRYARRGDGCVPRRIAHERIRADGWYDFGNFEARGNLVYMQARRHSGRLFDLTVDTCSGEVVAARPLFAGRTFAGAPRRYWQQRY